MVWIHALKRQLQKCNQNINLYCLFLYDFGWIHGGQPCTQNHGVSVNSTVLYLLTYVLPLFLIHYCFYPRLVANQVYRVLACSNVKPFLDITVFRICNPGLYTALLFTHIWYEKRWIHKFPMCIWMWVSVTNSTRIRTHRFANASWDPPCFYVFSISILKCKKMILFFDWYVVSGREYKCLSLNSGFVSQCNLWQFTIFVFSRSDIHSQTAVK